MADANQDPWIELDGGARMVCIRCRQVFDRGRRCGCDADDEAETAGAQETTAVEVAREMCKGSAPRQRLLSRAGIMAELARMHVKANRAKSIGLERIREQRQILRQLHEMIAGDDLPAKLDAAEAALRRLEEKAEEKRGAAGIDDLAGA